MTRAELGAFARERAELAPDQPMVIAADKSIKYEIVMDVMARLKENGIKRVGLAVKNNWDITERWIERSNISNQSP